jgi:acetylornithine deacetylase/succinyl-diaminopimelate desuccinylase-like protein
VPDHCRVEVDRRTVPGEDPGAILSEIRVGLQELQARGAVSGFEIRVIKDGRPFATAGDSPLVTRLLRASRAAGVAARAVGAAWFSDAGPFAQTCPAVAVFGPGSIHQAHTCDEYIEVESLQRGAVILADFFRAFAAETRVSGA